jgi:hypothetical protein
MKGLISTDFRAHVASILSNWPVPIVDLYIIVKEKQQTHKWTKEICFFFPLESWRYVTLHILCSSYRKTYWLHLLLHITIFSSPRLLLVRSIMIATDAKKWQLSPEYLATPDSTPMVQGRKGIQTWAGHDWWWCSLLYRPSSATWSDNA